MYAVYIPTYVCSYHGITGNTVVGYLGYCVREMWQHVPWYVVYSTLCTTYPQYLHNMVDRMLVHQQYILYMLSTSMCTSCTGCMLNGTIHQYMLHMLYMVSQRYQGSRMMQIPQCRVYHCTWYILHYVPHILRICITWQIPLLPHAVHAHYECVHVCIRRQYNGTPHVCYVTHATHALPWYWYGTVW